MTTPLLIDFIAAGFHGAKRELTITLVRILFPGAGLLVLSAWCLGILNSHRRFLLSYSVPVLWNAAMIAALLWSGARTGQDRLAAIVAWASVAGSALMFLVQLPVVLRLVPALRVQLATHLESVRVVMQELRSRVRQQGRRATQRLHRCLDCELAAHTGRFRRCRTRRRFICSL